MNDLIIEILGAVSSLGPSQAYGGAIWDRVDEARGIHHSSGEMYTVLHHLRDAGCIKFRKQEHKVYYEITDMGRRELYRLLRKRIEAGEALPA